MWPYPSEEWKAVMTEEPRLPKTQPERQSGTWPVLCAIGVHNSGSNPYRVNDGACVQPGASVCSRGTAA